MPSMQSRKARASLLIVCLLATGALLPVIDLSGAWAAPPTAAQLGLMVSAAQTSRAYAAGLISYGSIHSVDSSSANSALSSGDSLLAKAQAELSSGSDVAAGVADAQGAMTFYSQAAADISLSLEQSGLTGSVGVDAVAGSVAQVNETLAALSSASASACASVSSSSNSTLVQACASARTAIERANLELETAINAIASINTGASASVVLPTAAAALLAARQALGNASASLEIASDYGYAARGAAFQANILAALSARANASIALDRSISSSLATMQKEFSAYQTSLSSADANLSALSTAIATTKFSTVSADLLATSSTSSEVESTTAAFLTLLGALSLPGDASLVSSVKACQSAAAVYAGTLTAGLSSSGEFASSSSASYGTYLGTYQAQVQGALTAQASYVARFRSMQSNLSAFIKTLAVVPPQLTAENTTLASLGASVAETTVATSAGLQAQLNALTTVQSDLTIVKTMFQGTSLVVDLTAVSQTSIDYSAAASNLNSTAYSELLTVKSDVGTSANETSAFVSQVQAALSGSISQFNSSTASIISAGAHVEASGATTASSLSKASSFVSSDLAIRESSASSARASASEGLKLLQVQDISAGIASLEVAASLYAAASVSYT